MFVTALLLRTPGEQLVETLKWLSRQFGWRTAESQHEINCCDSSTLSTKFLQESQRGSSFPCETTLMCLPCCLCRWRPSPSLQSLRCCCWSTSSWRRCRRASMCTPATEPEEGSLSAGPRGSTGSTSSSTALLWSSSWSTSSLSGTPRCRGPVSSVHSNRLCVSKTVWPK